MTGLFASAAIERRTRRWRALEVDGFARAKAYLAAKRQGAGIPIRGWLIVVAKRVAVDRFTTVNGEVTPASASSAGSRAIETLTQGSVLKLAAAETDDADDKDGIRCIDAEILLAGRACLGSTRQSAALEKHLFRCRTCLRVASGLENDVVAQALLEVAEGATDLTTLPVIAEDIYLRGQEIGRGAIGRVVRARDRRLGRWVAIKELLDDGSRR